MKDHHPQVLSSELLNFLFTAETSGPPAPLPYSPRGHEEGQTGPGGALAAHSTGSDR